MRESTAAVAIIRREHKGQTLWLAQWNGNWQCYHFVGGHKRADEMVALPVAIPLGQPQRLALVSYQRPMVGRATGNRFPGCCNVQPDGTMRRIVQGNYDRLKEGC
jgi:hypothetical protein